MPCCSAVGDLPLAVIGSLNRLRSNSNSTYSELGDYMTNAGFTLPANIGDLDLAITCLDLSRCNLTGGRSLLCYSILESVFPTVFLFRVDS